VPAVNLNCGRYCTWWGETVCVAAASDGPIVRLPDDRLSL
jgi:hypothetical protein